MAREGGPPCTPLNSQERCFATLLSSMPLFFRRVSRPELPPFGARATRAARPANPRPRPGPPWNSAKSGPELNKTRRVTLGLPHKYVALVRSWAGSKKGKVPKRGERVYAGPRRDVSVRRQFLLLIYFNTATRGSARDPLINRNATVFAAKPAVFLRPGPASENFGHPIGRSGWQCPAVPTSRARTCENAEFEGGGTEKMKENGPLCALSSDKCPPRRPYVA